MDILITTVVEPSVEWGGTVEDYLSVHNWFDGSKQIIADFRHRALRHSRGGDFHAETFSAPRSRSRPAG